MKTWFITGASRGFGHEWTEAALKRGDKVAAAVRNTDGLKGLAEQYGDGLLPVPLDVNSRDAAFAAIKAAQDHFGRLDVVVNNAGYGQFGMAEEISEAEARAQMETNFFGALWVTQAACPTCGRRGAAISCRSPASAGSGRSRTSACTMRRSGRWKGSARR